MKPTTTQSQGDFFPGDLRTDVNPSPNVGQCPIELACSQLGKALCVVRQRNPQLVPAALREVARFVPEPIHFPLLGAEADGDTH